MGGRCWYVDGHKDKFHLSEFESDLAKSPPCELSPSCSPTVARMPPVLLTPTEEVPGSALYQCPVFRTTLRGGGENLAMVINLPIAGSNTTWIERGVALTIQKVRQRQAK